jgi:hypothetical protein
MFVACGPDCEVFASVPNMDKVDFWCHCVSHHSKDQDRAWRALFELWGIEHNLVFVAPCIDHVKTDHIVIGGRNLYPYRRISEQDARPLD